MKLNQKGNALFSLIAASAVVMIVSYTAIEALRVGRMHAVQQERKIEGELLARDLLEIVKYLFLYERVFYVDSLGPFNNSGSRGQKLVQLMSDGLGASSSTAASLMRACGGFDAKGQSIGEYKVDGIPVFCPTYLRSSLMSAEMYEQMILRALVEAGILKSDLKGQYVLSLVFFDADRGIDQLTKANDHYLGFDNGQPLLQNASGRIQEARVDVTIFGPSSNIASKTAERMLEIKSSVILKDEGAAPVTLRQSLNIYPSSPKDFALFAMFPTKSDGVTRTANWSESVILPAGSTIQGRVYFNGNFDVDFETLPVFTEMVVISGDFVPPLTKAQRDRLPEKFAKGLITNFSSSRYLLSGFCSPDVPSMEISNGARFPCKYESTGQPFTIERYFDQTNRGVDCMYEPVAIVDGVANADCKNSSNASCELNCKDQQMLSGARSNVTATGSVAFIAAPVGKMTLNVAYLYGTIFSGHIRSNRILNLRSMATAKVGDPGFGSQQETLDAYTVRFNQSNVGISVPIDNLPIVMGGDISR